MSYFGLACDLTRAVAELRPRSDRCPQCGGAREPLLEYEVDDPAGRASTELCRDCYDLIAA